MFNRRHLLLLAILIAAFSVRFYNINNFPALNPDEAALGYNAYSLIETGKDEHGAAWPIHFKSFGDYKPGGYVYLAIPFIKILGLNPLAVRLPNLIISVVTIYVLYLLIVLLAKSETLGILSAFTLAISPWHIHFSRGAWESSAALGFLILGIYLFYHYVYKHHLLSIYLSPLAFVASLYIYHSARLIAPLIIISLAVLHWKFLFKNFHHLILPITIGIVLTIPVLFSFVKNGGTARFGGVGLTADYGPISRAEELLNQHANVKLVNRIIHNRRVLYALSWGQKYVSHFDLNFLFINGDEVPRSKSPESGQAYLVELPLFIIGFVLLIRNEKLKELRSLVLVLLVFAPIASSLTYQAPSALRALPLVIPLTIIIGCGLYQLQQWLNTSKPFLKIPVISLIIAVYLYSFVYYIDTYFIHAPKRYPYAWNNGFSQIIPYIESQKVNYENIYFTDKYDQPYILYLFFSQYYPPQIQSQIELTPPDRFGFSTVRQIDNIHFEKINWATIPRNSLVVAADESVPKSPIKTINFPNGEPGFKIYIK